MARFLWHHAAGPASRERLVWTTEWGVWSSGEHMPLVVRLRHALGETRSLVEAPGCLCGANDQDDGLSISLVNCLFLWDCWLLGADGSAVFLSHDQVGSVFAPDKRIRSEIAVELESLAKRRY